MSQNVSRCPKMSKNVEKCPSRLWEKMVGNDWENSQNSPNSSKSLLNCRKLSQNVPKCPLQTHRCPNGLIILQIALTASVVFTRGASVPKFQVSMFPPGCVLCRLFRKRREGSSSNLGKSVISLTKKSGYPNSSSRSLFLPLAVVMIWLANRWFVIPWLDDGFQVAITWLPSPSHPLDRTWIEDFSAFRGVGQLKC